MKLVATCGSSTICLRICDLPIWFSLIKLNPYYNVLIFGTIGDAMYIGEACYIEMQLLVVLRTGINVTFRILKSLLIIINCTKKTKVYSWCFFVMMK